VAEIPAGDSLEASVEFVIFSVPPMGRKDERTRPRRR
jgi:hypothetical protein